MQLKKAFPGLIIFVIGAGVLIGIFWRMEGCRKENDKRLEKLEKRVYRIEVYFPNKTIVYGAKQVTYWFGKVNFLDTITKEDITISMENAKVTMID